MRRWMPWALALSLGLNLLVLGAVAGAALTGGWTERSARRGGGPEVALVRALPRAERAALRDVLRRHGGRREDLRAALVAAVAAAPYDADGLRAVLDRAGAARRDAQAEAAEALAVAIGRLSEAERAALAARIAR